MIRLLLVDDHAIVRRGLKQSLTSDRVEIIGEANGSAEAMNLLKTIKPDVLVTDISMNEMSGIELTKWVRQEYPDIKTLVLSTHNDEEYILESFEAGAYGYLPKDTDPDEILKAVETIATGQVYYSSSVAQILAMATVKNNGPLKSLKSMLTLREKEILNLLVDGTTNKEIGSRLFISVRTVDAHRRNIMKKLDVNNSAELVRVAFENRLVKLK